jgi:uncharacterized protein YndB with AHSA1/START domain
MDTANKTLVTVEATIDAALDYVWSYWTSPEHIMHWCHASDDWYAPHVENDLRVEGEFKITMAAKDGSASFYFEGVYAKVADHALIEYTLSDGRLVSVAFSGDDKQSKIVESFEAESTNPVELQQTGWQAILNNFKTYVEQGLDTED